MLGPANQASGWTIIKPSHKPHFYKNKLVTRCSQSPVPAFGIPAPQPSAPQRCCSGSEPASIARCQPMTRSYRKPDQTRINPREGSTAKRCSNPPTFSELRYGVEERRSSLSHCAQFGVQQIWLQQNKLLLFSPVFLFRSYAKDWFRSVDVNMGLTGHACCWWHTEHWDKTRLGLLAKITHTTSVRSKIFSAEHPRAIMPLITL